MSSNYKAFLKLKKLTAFFYWTGKEPESVSVILSDKVHQIISSKEARSFWNDLIKEGYRKVGK